MTLRYEIENDTYAIRVFNDSEDVPFLYQPHWPNGESWGSFNDADTWAKLYIDALENEEDENVLLPPTGPGVEAKRQQTGVTRFRKDTVI